MYYLESSYKGNYESYSVTKIQKFKWQHIQIINPQIFLYTYLDLAGAEMTASTAVGSKAIAAKVVHLDPTSFKSLYSLYFN